MRTFLILLLALSSVSAHAALIVRLERVGSSVDFPHLTLLNTGPEVLSDFSLTIGDESVNFDSAVLDGVTDVTFEVLFPDEMNAAIRSDIFYVSFTDFVSGSATWKLDLDGDISPATVDWQTTLFNNGALPNAVATATWLDGHVSSMILPDEPDRDALSPYSVTLRHVPEPSALSQFALGLIALWFYFAIIIVRSQRMTETFR